MNAGTVPRGLQTGYVLRFPSLHRSGQGLSFPCDERGNVELDALPETARNNYLAARARVGRDFAYPVVERVEPPGR